MGAASEAFKKKMIRYIFKAQTMKRLRRLLRNADDREFISAFKLVVERAFGKPTQQVDMKIERTIEDLLEESYAEEESDEADR